MKRKHITKGFVVLSLLCVVVFAAITLVGQERASARGEVLVLAGPMLLGQEWSCEQKEVWKAAEKLRESFLTEDVDEHLSCFHPDYHSFYRENPLQSHEARRRKGISHRFATEKWIYHNHSPIQIRIYGNVAFVHYFCWTSYEDAEGERKSGMHRGTKVWMKEGDKWRVIYQHGYPPLEE